MPCLSRIFVTDDSVHLDAVRRRPPKKSLTPFTVYHDNRRRVETGGSNHDASSRGGWRAEQEIEAVEVGHLFTSPSNTLARQTRKRQATTVETTVSWSTVAEFFGLAISCSNPPAALFVGLQSVTTQPRP